MTEREEALLRKLAANHTREFLQGSKMANILYVDALAFGRELMGILRERAERHLIIMGEPQAVEALRNLDFGDES